MSYNDLTKDAVIAEFSTERRGTLIQYKGEDINAIFRLLNDDSPGRNRDSQADTGSLLVLKDDVVDPEYRDQAVINGNTWRVIREMGGSGPHFHKLLIETDRRMVL